MRIPGSNPAILQADGEPGAAATSGRWEMLDLKEAQSIRDEKYNATVTKVKLSTPTHRVIRIRPDAGKAPRVPGQYIGMGLGAWESPAAGSVSETLNEEQWRELIVRHYSFSHPIVDGVTGELIEADSETEYEFFISMTPGSGASSKLQLTPRLMALIEGDRIFVESEAAGEYTLEGVQPEADVIFAATGTGQSAHNAMAWQLLHSKHRGRIVTITCTRYADDQAYADAHRTLGNKLSNYSFISLVTREPSPDILSCRIQSLFSGPELQKILGWLPKPENAHVFLCGNPAMIGAPVRDNVARKMKPQPGGMVELLTNLGFSHKAIDGRPANIHFERFW
jgi:ferredoxin--NADP+ reductase